LLIPSFEIVKVSNWSLELRIYVHPRLRSKRREKGLARIEVLRYFFSLLLQERCVRIGTDENAMSCPECLDFTCIWRTVLRWRELCSSIGLFFSSYSVFNVRHVFECFQFGDTSKHKYCSTLRERYLKIYLWNINLFKYGKIKFYF